MYAIPHFKVRGLHLWLLYPGKGIWINYFIGICLVCYFIVYQHCIWKLKMVKVFLSWLTIIHLPGSYLFNSSWSPHMGIYVLAVVRDCFLLLCSCWVRRPAFRVLLWGCLYSHSVFSDSIFPRDYLCTLWKLLQPLLCSTYLSFLQGHFSYPKQSVFDTEFIFFYISEIALVFSGFIVKTSFQFIY